MNDYDDANLMQGFMTKLGLTVQGAAHMLDYSPAMINRVLHSGCPLAGWRRRRIDALVAAFEKGGWRAAENVPMDYSRRKGESRALD